jgi:hypothetical protein
MRSRHLSGISVYLAYTDVVRELRSSELFGWFDSSSFEYIRSLSSYNRLGNVQPIDFHRIPPSSGSSRNVRAQMALLLLGMVVLI